MLDVQQIRISLKSLFTKKRKRIKRPTREGPTFARRKPIKNPRQKGIRILIGERRDKFISKI